MGSHRITRAIKIALAATAAAALAILYFALVPQDGDEVQMSYNAVDAHAQMLKNGDLRITQTFDYRLPNRGTPWRQLYQQFELSSDRLTNVTDISVKDLRTGQTYTQGDVTTVAPIMPSDAQWNSEYAGSWYIADITRSEKSPEPYDPAHDALTPTAMGEPRTTKNMEIGWNIPSTRGARSMQFELSMTWHGVATAYDDVVSLEWEPLSQSDAVPAARVTGTFTFPEGIGESNSWAWLHTGAANETTRGPDGSLQFTATGLSGGEYINVVVMTEKQAGSGVARTQTGKMKQRILDQESQEAQIAYDSGRGQARWRLAMWLIPAVITLILVVAALVNARRTYVQGRRRTEELAYWRDPPAMSPAAAAALITDVAADVQGSTTDRQLTSTLLSLVTKGAIAIYPGSAASYRGIDMSRADCVSISRLIASDPRREADAEGMCTLVILPRAYADRAGLRLCRSENALLDMLLQVGPPVFDFNQMQAALSPDAARGFAHECDAEYQALHATRLIGAGGRVLSLASAVAALATACFYLVFFGQLVLALAVALPLFFASVFAWAVSPRVALTPQGEAYANQVAGLMRYMEDFSEFSDRGVFDTVLWGRYMVYAAAFGISDKLMEQMERAYPQFADPAWVDAHASNNNLVYWSARRRLHGTGLFSAGGGSFSSMIDANFASIGSTIRDAMPKSGGGGGGSFRGGGFRGHSGGSGGMHGGAR